MTSVIPKLWWMSCCFCSSKCSFVCCSHFYLTLCCNTSTFWELVIGLARFLIMEVRLSSGYEALSFIPTPTAFQWIFHQIQHSIYYIFKKVLRENPMEECLFWQKGTQSASWVSWGWFVCFCLFLFWMESCSGSLTGNFILKFGQFGLHLTIFCLPEVCYFSCYWKDIPWWKHHLYCTVKLSCFFPNVVISTAPLTITCITPVLDYDGTPS